MAGLLAAIGRLCEGEVRNELQDAYQVARTEEAYLASIEGKTASLLSSACRIGAIVADLPRPEIDALTEFGLAYGMAFQIVDDILDVVATDERAGKPAGHDLVEGAYNLPVLRGLAGPSGPELAALLGAPSRARCGASFYPGAPEHRRGRVGRRGPGLRRQRRGRAGPAGRPPRRRRPPGRRPPPPHQPEHRPRLRRRAVRRADQTNVAGDPRRQPRSNHRYDDGRPVRLES